MAVQKTSISILQELMQRNKKPIPTYCASDVVNCDGYFTCSVTANDIVTLGCGKTKKEAKHDCAKNAIAAFQGKTGKDITKTVDVLIAPSTAPFAELPIDNYIGTLNEFCSKNSLSYPEYKENGFDGQYFNVTCSLLEINAVGKGFNKKIAKQRAASVVLEELKLSDTWKNRIIMEEIPKLICDKTDIKKITEIYSNLSIMGKRYIPTELNVSTEIDFSKCNLKELHDIRAMPSEEEQYPDIETSEEELRNLKVDYSVATFVREPLMLIFKAEGITPSTFTLIQDGATIREAKKILLAKAVKFIDILKN